jgi:hypothetical protein
MCTYPILPHCFFSIRLKAGMSASRIEGIGKRSLRRPKLFTIKGSSASEEEVSSILYETCII